MANIRNEKGVKDAVKKALTKAEWFWFMPPANAYGKAGISDILAIKNGVLLAVETKFGANKPTPLQVGFCNSIRAEKGFAFVVNEKNLVWFDRWLECFDNAVQGVADQKGVETEDGADLINAIAVLTEML